MQNITLWAAFGAGVAAFFTPCHLALVPAYVAFLAGDGQTRWRLFVFNAMAFCMGFGVVFVILGASFGFLGAVLAQYQGLFRWCGGLIMFVFGLHMAGWVAIPFLYRERRWRVLPRSGPGGAFALGFSFGFAWTPCVGPVLGSILALAGLTENMLNGVRLLTAYTIGMSAPFFIVAALVYQGSAALLQRFYPVAALLSKAGGLLLALLGVLIILNRFPM